MPGPFDEELEKDRVVTADAAPNQSEPRRIETPEEFSRRVEKLSPQELSELLAVMKATKP